MKTILSIIVTILFLWLLSSTANEVDNVNKNKEYQKYFQNNVNSNFKINNSLLKLNSISYNKDDNNYEFVLYFKDSINNTHIIKSTMLIEKQNSKVFIILQNKQYKYLVNVSQ